jgi:hypothetical protein
MQLIKLKDINLLNHPIVTRPGPVQKEGTVLAVNPDGQIML